MGGGDTGDLQVWGEGILGAFRCGVRGYWGPSGVGEGTLGTFRYGGGDMG